MVSEPSVVAIDAATGEVHAVGAEAERMIGRTPATISAVRPLRHGVIADFAKVARGAMSLKTKALIRRSLWTASARGTRYEASCTGAQGSWHESLYRPARALTRSSLLVELTREGRDLVAAARPTTLANKRRLLSSLMAEEQSMLAMLLRKLLLRARAG